MRGGRLQDKRRRWRPRARPRSRFPIYAVSYFSRASFLYLRLPISYSFLFYEGRQYSRTGTGTLLIVKVMYCTVLYMYLKVLAARCTGTVVY